jgi:beta-phosphoglucomutase-like phosphatase (HAD superfamily)
MDGVLIDACPIHRDSFRAACAEHGTHFTEDTERELEGRPTRVKLQMLGVDPETAHNINRAKQEYTLAAAKRYPPDREKVYLLSAIHGAGIRIGVYSNAIFESVRQFLYSACLQPFVESVTTNESVNRPKPDPEGYLQLMAHFGVRPHETLIVEDSPVGLEAAFKTGAHVLTVTGPGDVTFSRVREAIEKAGGTGGLDL